MMVLSKEELNQVLAHAASGGIQFVLGGHCDEVRNSHEALRAQRDEARQMYCRLEAFRRNGNGGLFIPAFTVSPHDVAEEKWPDSADALFPRMRVSA